MRSVNSGTTQLLNCERNRAGARAFARNASHGDRVDSRARTRIARAITIPAAGSTRKHSTRNEHDKHQHYKLGSPAKLPGQNPEEQSARESHPPCCGP